MLKNNAKSIQSGTRRGSWKLVLTLPLSSYSCTWQGEQVLELAAILYYLRL